eukprot:TRINITY_DN23158_c0_g1_i1.p1 TRINITY_DN23158_c0_g1~~TRINITY_DN23158_c0_g1_i1.p1  ORF type:complete len:537 (+),score=133.41 TRINITY_DN23158_c0_g1_i1:43-1611(+)
MTASADRLHTADPPYGFFVDDDTVTQAPRAVVRNAHSTYEPATQLELVATAHLQPGDVILEEKPLLEWVLDDTQVLTGTKASSPAETILLQRCLAIKKMSEQMKAAGQYCGEVLPLLHAFCTRYQLRGDTQTILDIPYTLRDTRSDQEALKLKAGFCVMAQKGLTKTIHEKAIPDHQTLSRLCVIAERGAMDCPLGKALYKFTSHAHRMAYAKPKLISVGARPGSKRSKAPEAPTPNADYDIDESGTLRLRAKRHIAFGDVVSVPKEKVFEKQEKGMAVLRNRQKMREAVVHKARDSNAPDAVKAYAQLQHPRVPPFMPPKPSSALRTRNVANELWQEAPLGDMTRLDRPFISTIDFVFDNTESRSAFGALCREGVARDVQYYIGFESNSRVVTGGTYAALIQQFIARCGSHIPSVYDGKPLSGAAMQGLFLHITPGEELLEFAMQSTPPPGSVGIPFCLSLGSGNLLLNKCDVRVPLKPGRLVLWKPGLTHRVPIVQGEDAGVMLSYLIYGKPDQAQQSEA